ncbi:hypothetical protein DMC47_34785 [Nostoc sp. 3335mG]|nr:hypothetical protein DMC47_34785 [Nostoc sp. 3335mG]
MTIAAIALLMTIQAPVLVPEAPPTLRAGHVPPGMAYDPITDTYVPIKGWKPDTAPGMPAAGTKLQYNRVGQKIGEVPVRR